MKDNRLARVRNSSRAGFTLLELMAAIAVLGVLVAIGVPSFAEIIRNNRVTTQTNALVTAISIARSEASKRGMPVALCAAADVTQSSCAAVNAATWQFGYILFTDRTGAAGVVNAAAAGDVILQTFEASPASIALTTNNRGYVRFGSTGMPLPVGVDTTFAVQHQQCTGTNRRTIAVDRTGRVRTTKVACT